ncbi:MAG: quinolinate synthase NadA, partial [Desulfobacterales bacterium]
IKAIKNTLGEELVILSHHYQRKEIVELGDHRGDSFGLSQKAAENAAARFIVFCGVHFMAESAEILSQPHQTVQLPALDAGCWMADMADEVAVDRAWDAVTAITGEAAVIPMVYMNADAALKAFCGRHGGVVCTSSNAAAAFHWAFDRGEKIFFYPDQHLGRNTANAMGIKAEEIIVWKPGEPLGGHSAGAIEGARVILWDGYCLVHTRFKVAHIEQMRKRFPDAQIVVHPECTEDVVNAADAVGSTSFIVKMVENAPSGATIVIGTEINLIQRLHQENPDKNILDLHNSLCPNMFKINPQNLLWTLENIGKVNVITVPEQIKAESRVALDRMLALPA